MFGLDGPWGGSDLNMRSLFFEIAKGNVPGMTGFPIPGRKNSISAATLDDISQIPGATTIPNPGGVGLELISDSPADDGDPAGIGTQIVKIHFLDSSGTPRVEAKTMNGTTAVPTESTDIDKIQWMHSTDNGSSDVSVGNISLQGLSGGTVFEYIEAGGNQSLSCRYTIPTGKTGYIFGWQASGITKIIDIRLRATVDRFDRTLINSFIFQDVILLNDAPSGYIPFPIPLKIPATATFKASAKSSASGGDAGVQVDIVIVDRVE